MSNIEQGPLAHREPRCAKLAAKVRVLHRMEIELGVLDGNPADTNEYLDISCAEKGCNVTERFFPEGPTSHAFVNPADSTSPSVEPNCVAAPEASFTRIDTQIQNRAVELDAYKRNLHKQ